MSRVSRKHLAEIISNRTLKEKDPSKLARIVAAYLLEEGITGDLESLIRDVMQHRMDHGVLEARVVTAHTLPQNVLDDVQELLKKEYPDAQQIDLDAEVDPSVVGGIRIDLPNDQLDLTVKARLDTFKRLTVGGA